MCIGEHVCSACNWLCMTGEKWAALCLCPGVSFISGWPSTTFFTSLCITQEESSGLPSACALCLVTPDGQRTMRTCLAASLELKVASQLEFDWSLGIRLLHCEG